MGKGKLSIKNLDQTSLEGGDRRKWVNEKGRDLLKSW
jgi:hypothetical protein